MRYQNWDVLLFPDPSKIPLQEFKTSCQVIQDPESQNLQLNPQLLPTVTSFIPGLPTGTPFRVSIHCWQNPEISRVMRDLRKPSDTVLFEARMFIDGRMVASKWFGQGGPWPTVIDLSIDLDKHGEFERLKFPTFHRELLSQSYWNPADDLGRVKVIISEGFSREGLTYPFERIKNIVSFSFQHAPLDVLEASSIAWPNSSMWRQVSLMGPYLAQQISPRREADVEVHSHSPRQAQASRAPFPHPSAQFPPPSFGSMQPPNPPLFQRQPQFDPFTEPLPSSFMHWRQRSSADVSMPDYATTRGSSSRQVSDPMQGTEPTNPVFEAEQPSVYESLIEALGPKAPSNTPKTGAATPVTAPPTANVAVSRKSSGTGAPAERGVSDSVERTLRTALGNALRNKSGADMEDQPPIQAPAQAPVQTLKQITNTSIRSRKENMYDTPLGPEPSAAANETCNRVVSQTFVTTNNAGTKRSRVVTPAAAKVIDDEDEPRTSPSVRQVSRSSIKQVVNENERKVSGVQQE